MNLWFVGAAFALPLSAPCVSAATGQSILEVVSALTNHTILTQALNITGFSEDLNNATFKATLFAPTQDDFKHLQAPQAYYVQSKLWEGQLQVLMKYHIVPEPLDLSHLLALNELPTLSTSLTIPVNKTDKTIGNGAAIIGANINASNGFIQVPDRVLIPQLYQMTVAELFFNSTTNGSIFEQFIVASNFSYFNQIFQVAQKYADVTESFFSSNF